MLSVGKSERVRTSSIPRSASALAPPTVPLQSVNVVITNKAIDVKTRLSAGGSYGDESRSN